MSQMCQRKVSDLSVLVLLTTKTPSNVLNVCYLNYSSSPALDRLRQRVVVDTKLCECSMSS